MNHGKQTTGGIGDKPPQEKDIQDGKQSSCQPGEDQKKCGCKGTQLKGHKNTERTQRVYLEMRADHSREVQSGVRCG